MRGKIMTCCYNKSYLLGEYPQENLHHIWFGEKRKQLAKSLEENDFSNGCQNCYEIIKAKNISGLTAKKFDHLPLNKDYPTRIDFELSNECNLECTMCRGEYSSSIRKNVEQLPPIPSPYNSTLLEELKEFIPHLTACHFLGGEPFMIPIYQDIWDLIIEINPGVRISVLTNGTLLSERVKKILEKLNCDIGVSIDSLDEKNYSLIRKNGNLKKVKENILYLRDYAQRKNTNFHLSTCAMSINSGEFIAMTEFANALNCSVFFTHVSYPRELSLEIQTKEYLNALAANIRNARLETDTEVKKTNYKTLNDLAGHFEFLASSSENFTAKQSISHYLDGLNSFLKISAPDNYHSIFENIKGKIVFILEVAAKNNAYELAEKKMCEVPYKTMYEMVPGIEKEHLLHLFKSYLVPIEE